MNNHKSLGLKEVIVETKAKRHAQINHYQTGRGTLCSLDNDASIRTHTQDKSTVTCHYCLNLLGPKEAVAAPPQRDTPRQNCSHNTMVELKDNPTWAWQCADCGYIYGKHGTPRPVSQSTNDSNTSNQK